jgi:hypothetical protein
LDPWISRFEVRIARQAELVNGLPFFRFEQEDTEVTEKLVNGAAKFQLD